MMSSVIWLTSFDTFASILSTLPLASPGMLNFGFLVRMYSRLGLMIFIVYGPAPGGGLAVESLNGDLAAGVGAADGSPAANRMRLSGLFSVSLISPVLSSVTMPGNGAFSFFAATYFSAPTTSLQNEEYGPPRNSSRLIVFAKSLALTGDPSEYWRLDRSLNA